MTNSLKNLVENEINFCKNDDSFTKFSLTNSQLDLLKTNQECWGYYRDIPRASGRYFYLLHLLTQHDDMILNIVELGNREGLSTLAISTALSNKQKFTSIDIIRDLRYVPSDIKQKSNIEFIIGDCLSTAVIEQVPNNIDLILFDTIHTYQQVSQEWAKYKPLLSDESLVLIDDINFADKDRILDDLGDECHVITNNWLHGSGFAVIVFNRKNK